MHSENSSPSAMPKTYKRETAIAMLAFLAAVFLAGMITESEAVLDTGEFLTPFIFVFSAAAFGLDALAKQIRT